MVSALNTFGVRCHH